MADNLISKDGIHIIPKETAIYVPPLVWKGDPIGHIGKNDTFFYVLEGECFLKVESEYSVIKSGQLAFLPKGKMRSYTQVSNTFSMYEMSFSANVGERNLMEIFGMTDGDFVVSVENTEEMRSLFESSYRTEMHKDALYDLSWCSSALSIINIYLNLRRKHDGTGKAFFIPVVKYMEEHLTKQIKVEELASLVYMEPTYFIRRFKMALGLPPLTYFIRMRMYRAMGYLSGSNLSIEEISALVGISDSAYFSRLFKKFCNTSPSEFRKVFQKNMIN